MTWLAVACAVPLFSFRVDAQTWMDLGVGFASGVLLLGWAKWFFTELADAPVSAAPPKNESL